LIQSGLLFMFIWAAGRLGGQMNMKKNAYEGAGGLRRGAGGRRAVARRPLARVANLLQRHPFVRCRAVGREVFGHVLFEAKEISEEEAGRVRDHNADQI
jgi:hypothetical protein